MAINLAQRIWSDIRRGILKGLPTYNVGCGRPDPYSCVLEIGASCASPPLVIFDSIDHLLAREPSSWMPRDMWDNPLICESFLRVENVESLGLREDDDIEYVGLHVADSDPLWSELAHVARMTRSVLVEAEPTMYPNISPCKGVKKTHILYSRLNPKLIDDATTKILETMYVTRSKDPHSLRTQAVEKFLAMREERVPF